MWTPRRVLLLLGGILLSCGVYGVYARFLGWLDGLPQLPAPFLQPASNQPRPPVRITSPTVQRLIEAFGANCPESQDNKVYETKLEFRNGDSSVVLACGPPQSYSNSNRVILTPFSLAVFGKPRPPAQRQPGEVVEINTFHSDKAVLEFDRPIGNPNDMNKAKLLRIELVSEPQALPDPRRGLVHITNNQRSGDPNKFLVMRTPGPVFYRDPKGVDVRTNPGAAEGPDIWTDAPIEIIDRQNLPRAFGAPSPSIAQAKGEEIRDPGAVPAILAGRRLPPPTVTAVGMRIFLEPAPNQVPGQPPRPKKEQSTFGDVRRVEFLEAVVFHLWTDADQAFASASPPGSPDKRPAGGNALAVPEPPMAGAAVLGGGYIATQNARQLNRALIQIDTLGPFTYDAEKNVARFDVVPQVGSNLPNDVQVTRMLPKGGRDQLFTQVLELEFIGPPTGPKPAIVPQPGTKPKPEEDGPSFKRVHAWTYTPGRILTLVHSEADGRGESQAYGQDLEYTHTTERTILTGAPVYAVRANAPREDGKPAGRTTLTAGNAQQPGQVIIEPDPAFPRTPATGDRRTLTTVRGPGRIEIFDPATNQNTIHATWQKSLVHAKQSVNKRDIDAFTFTDGASFVDTQADYWLKADVLTLWVEQAVRTDIPGPAESRALPNRLQALGNVTGHSADFDIESAHQLNVEFREGIPPPTAKKPEPLAAAPAPTLAAGPKPTAPSPPAPPVTPKVEPPKEPEKPKPPMKLRARFITTWVVRYPVAKPEPKPGTTPPRKADQNRVDDGSVRYEMEKAWCEDKVVVHQDPSEPDKPRGLDILSQTLLVDHTPDGSVLTVTGGDGRPAEVHYETMSILGPRVVIDQVHNLASVKGRGALSMPAGSDFSGSQLKQPEAMIIHWRDGMEFTGTTKRADFHGKVVAVQGESWVQCHTMQVVLDRVVYFNQLSKPRGQSVPAPAAGGAVAGQQPAKDKDTGNPKVERVMCWPAAGDEREEESASVITFNQVEKDPATGRVSKVQHLTVRELVMHAQAQDEGRGEKYQRIEAHGPGELRIWQAGQKDPLAPDPKTPAPPMNEKKAPNDPVEMKLTVVKFAGRMDAKDKGKIYQEATFLTNVQVTNMTADGPNVVVDPHRLPQGAVRLTCADRLIVTSHKQGDTPAVQGMRAEGNAFVRSDEYDGWGEVITSDGRLVTLYAGNTPAQIKSRFKGNSAVGKVITYDRAKGYWEVKEGYGGMFESSGQPIPPKK